MKTKESQEMYLETILILSERQNNVRSIDVAKELDFSRASVCRAIKLLQDEKYIEIDNNSNIILTPKGKETANMIFERHNILTAFFKMIGVSDETASKDACRIEHVISHETIDKIKEQLDLR